MSFFSRKKKPVENKIVDDAELNKIKDMLNQMNADLTVVPEESKVHEVKPAGIEKVKDRIWPERTFLIRMEMRSGDHTEFKKTIKESFFKYLGGTYLVDESLKYYVISSKCYALDYHQDCCLPIKRRIDVKKIKETINMSGSLECGASTNPSTLDQFVESKIAEGVMKAQAVDEFLKGIKIMIIIILILGVIHFLLFIKASGMFSNIKMPF